MKIQAKEVRQFLINFGKKIKYLRLGLGMTLIELEELSGIDISKISRIENNSATPDINEIFALAKALDCEVCDLIPCGYNSKEREFIKAVRSLSKHYFRQNANKNRA